MSISRQQSTAHRSRCRYRAMQTRLRFRPRFGRFCMAGSIRINPPCPALENCRAFCARADWQKVQKPLGPSRAAKSRPCDVTAHQKGTSVVMRRALAVFARKLAQCSQFTVTPHREKQSHSSRQACEIGSLPILQGIRRPVAADSHRLTLVW